MENFPFKHSLTAQSQVKNPFVIVQLPLYLQNNTVEPPMLVIHLRLSSCTINKNLIPSSVWQA